jgi:hypothetical protein
MDIYFISSSLALSLASFLLISLQNKAVSTNIYTLASCIILHAYNKKAINFQAMPDK